MGEAKRRKALDPNYGKPKHQKVPSNHFLKPLEINKIYYYSISERPEYVSYEVPESLRLPYLDLIPNLPKSILQITDPTIWHIESIKHGIPLNIEFGVLFDDYEDSRYDYIFNLPVKIIVVFLNTKKNNIFTKLESLDRRFVVLSDIEEIELKLQASTRLKDKYCRGYKYLIEKLTHFALGEVGSNHEDFLKYQSITLQEAMKNAKDIGIETNPNFIPCRSNIANIENILFGSQKNLLPLKAIDFNQRISTLVKTSLSLLELSRFIKLIACSDSVEGEKSLIEIDPTLVLIYPYFNPDYKKSIEADIRKLKGNDKDLAKLFKRLRFLEQSIQDYSNIVSTEGGIPGEIFFGIAREYAVYLKFLDFVGYLHSTFKMSPCIRTPSRGRSLNKYLSRVSPQQYKLSKDLGAMSRNIFEVGQAIRDNCPPEFIDFVKDNSNSVLAISDLPIEWMLVDDVPLSFLCDLCRMPESGPTSLLAQFNQNCSQEFIVRESIISKTLVVCGALKTDPISERFHSHVIPNSNSAKNVQSYTAVQVDSKEKFFKALDEFNPDLLIVDSHGNFDTQKEGSYIWMGNDKVTGKDIVSKCPQIPLVILSCCLGTPLYGNANTIAQAFFERGSFSVVSTFLPVSIDRGFFLYFRILNNLSYASKNSVHETWASFISHNLRTSYFEDLLSPAIEKYGFSIVDEDKYKEEKLNWLLTCSDRGKRHAVYKIAVQIVLKCIKKEYREKAARLIEKYTQLPDSMLYTHLGRGDLARFEAYE